MIPGLPRSLRSGGSFEGLGHLAGLGLVGATSIFGFQDRMRNGQNPALALGTELSHAAFSLVTPLPLYLGLTVAPGLIRAGTGALIGAATRHQNSFFRTTTPFGHRHEASDACMRAQAAGLQAVGSALTHSRMGSEAGAAAARYSRR